MSDYINFEAGAEHIEDEEVSDLSDNVSEYLFIDNNNQDTDVNFYRGFTNVENDIEQVFKKSNEKGLRDTDNLDKISDLSLTIKIWK